MTEWDTGDRQPTGGWTFPTFKEYVDAALADHEAKDVLRHEAADKALSAALSSAQAAVGKAEVSTDKRFETYNRFRETMADQAREYLPRPEYDVQHRALTDRIMALEASQTKMSSRESGFQAGWSMFIAAAAVLTSVVAIVIVIVLH